MALTSGAREPTAQIKGPGSGDGIIGDARMDSAVPKVKHSGSDDSFGSVAMVGAGGVAHEERGG